MDYAFNDLLDTSCGTNKICCQPKETPKSQCEKAGYTCKGPIGASGAEATCGLKSDLMELSCDDETYACCKNKNLIKNGDFELDDLSSDDTTLPTSWTENTPGSLTNVKYNIEKGSFGKVASINIIGPGNKYYGIKSHRIELKPNTQYTLEGRLACVGCSSKEDFKLLLHVYPENNIQNNFYYTINNQETYKSTYGYTRTKITFTTKSNMDLGAYVIASFLPNKQGKGYADEFYLEEIKTAVSPIVAKTCVKNSADVNQDGKINTADKTLINQWMAGSGGGGNCISPTWCDCTDIDQNGRVDQTDLNKIISILSNQESATVCGAEEYRTCSEIESVSPLASCTAKGLEYAKSTILDNSCITNEEIYGCCCKYGYNAASEKCYTYEQATTEQDEEDEDEDDDNGGGGGGDDNGDFITSTNLERGKTVELKERSEVRFKIDGKVHKLKVTDLTSSTARIKIESNTFEESFGIGSTRKYDITGDMWYDLKVKLNSISNRKAKITIWAINEKFNTKTQVEQRDDKNDANKIRISESDEEPEENNWWIYLVIGFIVLILFVLLLIFLSYKRKQRYVNY